MANETAAGNGELLAASVGEQLREKSDAEREAERERRAAEQRAEAAERRKADERHVVAEHGGDPETFRAAKEAARTRPVRRRFSTERLMLVALGVLLVLRVVARR